MTDNRTAEVRSKIMASVRHKDTGPEIAIRRLLHRLGYCYALHRNDLPGRPDLVFAPRRRVIFVHGCFWHGHGCPRGRLPTSRVEYWSKKIDNNRARDDRNLSDLKAMGWATCVVWQCETSDPDTLKERLVRFLDGGTS